MLFAAALVASVPCDGSPALACEVNTLAPANSSSVWALMGGHDIKLYQPVSGRSPLGQGNLVLVEL